MSEVDGEVVLVGDVVFVIGVWLFRMLFDLVVVVIGSVLFGGMMVCWIDVVLLFVDVLLIVFSFVV